MGRTFVYARVSTQEQTTANQLLEVASAGFAVESHRVVEETVSGSVAARQRIGFCRLRDRLERGDVLVVTKLDRLGRNAMDVRQTVDDLAQQGVRVHCLALGGADLTSASGRMTMQIIAAVAEFERDLLIERTHAGLARAREQGRKAGRPSALNREQASTACQMLAEGTSVSAVAKAFRTSRTTIQRLVRSSHTVLSVGSGG